MSKTHSVLTLSTIFTEYGREARSKECGERERMQCAEETVNPGRTCEGDRLDEAFERAAESRVRLSLVPCAVFLLMLCVGGTHSPEDYI